MTTPTALTQEIIDSAGAGRGLDRLVAEWVFGWTDVGVWCGCEHDGLNAELWMGVPPGRPAEPLPHYSTDARAAVLVLKSLGGRVTSPGCNESSGYDNPDWVAFVRAERDHPGMYRGCGATAAEAICRAALAGCLHREES